MKTTDATFLAKQIADSIEDDFRVELFEQFAGAITDRDSATQIKVSGDATSLLSNGDVFIIPTADFETEHTITTAPSYNAGTGKTTIICSGSTFTTDHVGLYIAKQTDITSDVVDQGISNIRIGTEGEALNTFLADDVSIILDNESGTYYNSGGTGTLNSGSVFWVKIFFFLKDYTSIEMLVFGGNVHPNGIEPVADDETVRILCSGHLKELERYPGWRVAEAFGDLANIQGIEMIRVVEASGGNYEGVRPLEYKFPNGVDIKGLTINSVSSDTPVGWHVIKYQPPDLWQFDYGSWTQLTEGATGQTLTSDAGHTANVDVPSKFDLMAREDLIYVENSIAPEVTEIGKPTLQFNSGHMEQLKYDFERVILYDAGGASYADITREVCSYDIDDTDIFTEANDLIYIMSPRPFRGIYFDLDSNLVGTIEFKYLKDFSTWVTLSPTDGTSNFSQSGAITWDLPTGWRQTNITINAVDYEEYYILRIKVSAYTSGTAAIKRALRYFRLIGTDGAALDVKVKYEKLANEDRSDEIVLKENSSGTMEPCTFRQNMAFQSYLEALLDSSEYTSSYRTVDDLEVDAGSDIISLYGRPPRNSYDKSPTAICVDTSTTPETVYVGVEDELWKVTEEGDFEFVKQLDVYHKPSGTGSGPEYWIPVSIRQMAHYTASGNERIMGLAWATYDEKRNYANDPENRRRPAILFMYDIGTDTLYQYQVDTGGNLSEFYPGTHCHRDGHFDGVDANEIGQNSVGPVACGENICIPFPQICHYDNPWNGGAQNAVLYDNQGLTSNTVSGSGRKYPTAQELFFVPPGYFTSLDNQAADGDAGNLGFRFTLGQKGAVRFKDTDNVFTMVEWDGTNFYFAKINSSGTVTSAYDLTSYDRQVLAVTYEDFYFYFSEITWDDNGGTFPGDLSTCKLSRIDTAGTNYTTLFDFASDSVEANQSLAAGNEKYCVILEMVYNANEDSIHGVLLDKSDMTYHYFVYDITNDKLYTSQTGTGFTFQNHRQIKELVYNTADYDVYAAVVDYRYQEETAFLISASYTAPGGAADGTEITLTFESNIKEGETDVVQMCLGGSGRIYGITGNNDFYMFQYDDTFYPRFFFANTGDDSFRTVISELAEAMNMIHSIDPNRKIHFYERDSNKGSMTIEEDDHLLRDTMSPVRIWKHYYDGVEVAWENPFTGETGIERAGTFGWNRRILKVTNYFIQYPQLASLLASKMNTFFASLRREISFGAIPVWQLDNRDKITINHDSTFDFLTTAEWIVSAVEFDFWNAETWVEAFEKT